MAVLIASELRKEFAGDPLFENVSFTVGRSDRLSLAGANGAGKTTLLRAIAGETSLQGGKLAFAKGTRVALHDQRPPLEFDITLREYALSGARDLLEVEAELRRLEQAMAKGAHDDATLRRYAEAQARLEHAGGWAWRDRAAAAVRGLGFADDDLDRPLGTFSGGELTRASLARALAGSPDLLLLDEPTNHLDVQNLEWLERELETIDAAVILVAHDRWFLEAVTTSVLELSPGGAHYFAGPWHEWRQEKAARAAAAGKTADRVSGRHRPARALRRAVPLQEVEGEAGAGEAHADRAAREGALGGATGGRVADEEAPLARLRLPRPAAERAHRPRGRGHRALGRRQAAPRRRDDRRRARREGRARRPERGGQDDAARSDPRRASRSSTGRSPRARRRARLLLAARARAPDERLGARCDRRRDRAPAAAGAGAPRAVPLLRLGDARARR